jgi:hypothetical protein
MSKSLTFALTAVGAFAVASLVVCGGFAYVALARPDLPWKGTADNNQSGPEKRGAAKPDTTAASKTSKVTQANYDRLKLAMAKTDVEVILGPGREISSSVESIVMVWENGITKITVTFSFTKEPALLSKKIEP